MLKWIKPYIQDINDFMENPENADYMKFYTGRPYAGVSITNDDNEWFNIRRAIVSGEKLIGFVGATISREHNFVENLPLVNITGRISFIMARDTMKFIDDLFTIHEFRKMEFNVYVGNPAEKMYDKMVSRMGGRIVGTFRKSAKILGVGYCDSKHYEIMREEYLCRVK